MDDTKKEKNNIESENEKDSDNTETNDIDESDDIELEKDQEFQNFSTAQNKDVVASLRQKLKQSDEEKREYLLGWQRTKADYINSKKQDEEDRKNFIKYAEAEIISEIIPVLDSFEMAFANQTQLEGVPPEWRKGVEQIKNQLQSILSERGLTEINPTAKPFNPHEAEAIGIVETEESAKDHTVESVLQKGYKLKDKVIRPAKVKVWKFN
jgi:molecular chaperone GrpE